MSSARLEGARLAEEVGRAGGWITGEVEQDQSMAGNREEENLLDLPTTTAFSATLALLPSLLCLTPALRTSNTLPGSTPSNSNPTTPMPLLPAPNPRTLNHQVVLQPSLAPPL